MTVETKLTYDKPYIEEFSKERNEPEWMREFRADAFDTAERIDMPAPDKTKIGKWNFSRFKHAASGEKINSLTELPDNVKVFLDLENAPDNLIIQRNLDVAYNTLSKDLADKGVVFTDIFTALQEHNDLVKKYYMKDAISVDEHRMTALHGALMNGGVFIYIPPHVQVEQPLQTIFWQEDPEVATFNHVLVVADKGSSLTYVENYISDNEKEETVANIVSEVVALDEAKVSYGSVDLFAKGTTTYINRRGAAMGVDSSIDWALGQMNDGDTVSENITYLHGERSTSNARAVTVGRGKQSQNFTANIVHYGIASEGHILQHGVMKDKATTIFNGIGKIEHGASKSNAEQESRLLMLSERARGDANPILLIDEDDVTAGHAASVGRVDPNQLYYLMSRGITRLEAERLIVHGFLAPVVNELPIKSVQEQLTQVIEGKVY